MGVALAGWNGWGRDGWIDGLAQGTISVGFAVGIGRWIDRIIEQSKERRALLEQLESTRTELERANRDAGASAERQRLAGEIHDTLAQGFTSILMVARGAAGAVGRDDAEVRRLLKVVEDTATENLAEARSLVAALQPVALQETSLPDAIGRLCARFRDETGVDATAAVLGDRRRLRPAEDVVLLRSAQEALANVRKHADAASVRVTLAFERDAVRLVVCDDGRGFDRSASSAGFGLEAMRTRVHEIGGQVDLRSEPGSGTTLEVAL